MDEAILRKLTAEGEGGGDDRRFTIMAKLLQRIIDKPETSSSDAYRIIQLLQTVLFAARKQSIISTVIAEQLNAYSQLCLHIEDEMRQCANKMTEAKAELGRARLVRKNRQEYDLMAKMIEEFPSREETTRKLTKIKEELNQHQLCQRELELKLCDRRNHLHAFAVVLSNFERFLTDEEKFEDKEMSAESADRGDS